eukprot:Em0001g3367a
MELANQEEPVRTIKRQYIHLDDVLPPLETLVVAIEGSVDPAGVCCLSVPNRLMDDWAKKNEENTSFVALLNEYIVDEAVTFDPEATRLEDLLYRKSLSMASKLRAAKGKMIHIHLTDDAASEKDDNMDLRVLYILDRYGIGDAFYHELAMLFSELPRSHSIKKARTDLNHTMQLTRIPGYEGAYRSFERSLCEQLSNMIAQDATSFPTDQKIKVRVSGDGAKFSRTSSFVLLSYAILMPAGRYLSGIAFAATFQEINGLLQLGSVVVSGKNYNIELIFSSDMKFMLTMLGLNAANAIYACPLCTVHRDCRWDMSKPESHYSITKARTLDTIRYFADI